MAWKKVGSGEMIDFKRDGKGTETIGKYIGKQEGAGNFGGTLHHIEVEGILKSGFGSAVLDSRLLNVKPGTQIKIIYLGQEKGKNFPNPMHMYDVYEDDGTGEGGDTPSSDIPF